MNIFVRTWHRIQLWRGNKNYTPEKILGLAKQDARLGVRILFFYSQSLQPHQLDEIVNQHLANETFCKNAKGFFVKFQEPTFCASLGDEQHVKFLNAVINAVGNPQLDAVLATKAHSLALGSFTAAKVLVKLEKILKLLTSLQQTQIADQYINNKDFINAYLQALLKMGVSIFTLIIISRDGFKIFENIIQNKITINLISILNRFTLGKSFCELCDIKQDFLNVLPSKDELLNNLNAEFSNYKKEQGVDQSSIRFEDFLIERHYNLCKMNKEIFDKIPVIKLQEFFQAKPDPDREKCEKLVFYYGLALKPLKAQCENSLVFTNAVYSNHSSIVSIVTEGAALDIALKYGKDFIRQHWVVLLDIAKTNEEGAAKFFESDPVKDLLKNEFFNVVKNSNKKLLNNISLVASTIKYLISTNKAFTIKVLDVINSLKDIVNKLMGDSTDAAVTVIDAPYFELIFRTPQERAQQLIQLVSRLSQSQKQQDKLKLNDCKEQLYNAALDDVNLAIEILENRDCFDLLVAADNKAGMKMNEYIVRIICQHAEDGFFVAMMQKKQLGPAGKKVDVNPLVLDENLSGLILQQPSLCQILDSKTKATLSEINSKKADAAAPRELETYFTLLGVDPMATTTDIEKAYRQLARKYHPDNPNTGNSNKFKEIKIACTKLTDYTKTKENTMAAIESNDNAPSFASPFLASQNTSHKPGVSHVKGEASTAYVRPVNGL